ncbi:MAG: L-aspartate oxidase [Gemmataceae bacterium]
MSTFELPRRYLVPFDGRRLPHVYTDILVIGAGLAGLRAALAAPEEVSVLVVAKESLADSSSQYAQGGIAGVMDPEDRFENHIEDTLRAGAGLCDRRVVEAVVREAPAELERLREWGTRFDVTDQGQLALSLEGGHSHRRIVHALGDATGQEVMRVVAERARRQEHIGIWERAFALDLLTLEEACIGALVWRRDWGLTLVWSKQTILASGGAGQIFRETTNPAVATGDGIAMAYRAGAVVRDMEFMQFHPTVLYVAGSARHLISEAVRGEGAYLRDRYGRRFMLDVDPRAELAPRDIVARAIVAQMEKTQHPSVYLDLSHLAADRVRRRFPAIDALCRSFGLDLAHDLIPVRPAAHYFIGGVTVDLTGRTTLPGLWACGEVTSSGLHGANRLASNSLLESLVYGAWCGAHAAQAALATSTPSVRLPHYRCSARQDALDVTDLRRSLQSLMGRQAGVIRQRAGLVAALADVDFWCRYVLDHVFASPEGWELQNMLTLSRLMLWAALERTESRGVHYRTDYPTPDDSHWLRHLDIPAPVFAQG